jgi:hypothetical protein
VQLVGGLLSLEHGSWRSKINQFSTKPPANKKMSKVGDGRLRESNLHLYYLLVIHGMETDCAILVL